MEETNGQLSFLKSEDSLLESQEPSIVDYARGQIKMFQSKIRMMTEIESRRMDSITLLKLNHALKNEMEVFISSFFKKYLFLTTEEQWFIQENYSSEYHKLCKLFLEYLDRYVYSEGLGNKIEDSFIVQLEKFIAMDQVSFRDSYYKEIIKTIVKRNKLRVNHYLIFSGKNLLERLNANVSLEEKNLAIHDLKEDVDSLITNSTIHDVFLKYDSDFIEKESAGVLSMLLLYYLNQYVYLSNSNSSIPEKMVEMMEMYIIYHMSSSFLLSKVQEETLKKVKLHVSVSLGDYIRKESLLIEKDIRDFDELEQFKKSKKFRFIEETENLDELPRPITKESLRLELEMFLNRVFMLSESHEKKYMPIFLEEMKEERHKALELGLQYLYRFGYSNLVCDEDFIFTLEDYIASEEDFHVKDPNLCLTKSTLFSRTNKRYVSASYGKSRNLLQSPRN